MTYLIRYSFNLTKYGLKCGSMIIFYFFFCVFVMNSAVNLTDEYIWNKYDKFSDKRTRGWFLVDSPVNPTVLILAYLATVWWGPRLMAKRKPFKLKGLLIVYNFLLVLLNGIILTEYFVGTSGIGYDYLCGPSHMDFNPYEMRILRATWLFYISKYLEFLDTVFFILRKKNEQLSVLHVYHHSTMVGLVWVSIKWYPSGAAVRIPMINSFIHVIMYSYYGLSALGPKVQQYLWWKKYLTRLQLTQFVISMIWSINSLKSGCNHPEFLDIINILYMATFLCLFGRFYFLKYTKKVK